MINLRELLFPIIQISFDIHVSGIASNSKNVKKDYLFVAISSVASSYAYEASSLGASAIILPFSQHNVFAGISMIGNSHVFYHDNPSYVLYKIAELFYNKQPKNVCAVTGTNGKSSTVHFVREIWEINGIDSISIGTLGVVSNLKILNENTSLTTPDAVDIHRILYRASEIGVNHAAIEASSHGIEQMRLHGVKISAAALTNVTLDHLDYHGDFHKYLKAKIKLFNEILVDGGYAILNCDIPNYHDIINVINAKNIVTYGLKGDIRLLSQNSEGDAQKLRLSVFGEERDVLLPLLGKFQAYNLLCALGLILCSDKSIKFKDLILDSISQLPGRLEMVKNNLGLKIVVDYSHTPDALENAISSLRWSFNGKLVIIFGCGGNREKSKRSVMGKIASSMADLVIVCDDNPRMENPEDIRREVLMGCYRSNAIEIPDRRKAIRYAIENAKDGDIILIAGKGSETHQIIGNCKIPYNDLDEIKSILQS